uniref:SFRICE_019754 n=1 Tax=Spodoptera frugiperda TaxID=7108 RepID=A0A2H1WEL1_SPOFR
MTAGDWGSKNLNEQQLGRKPARHDHLAWSEDPPFLRALYSVFPKQVKRPTAYITLRLSPMGEGRDRHNGTLIATILTHLFVSSVFSCMLVEEVFRHSLLLTENYPVPTPGFQAEALHWWNRTQLSYDFYIERCVLWMHAMHDLPTIDILHTRAANHHRNITSRVACGHPGHIRKMNINLIEPASTNAKLCVPINMIGGSQTHPQQRSIAHL